MPFLLNSVSRMTIAPRSPAKRAMRSASSFEIRYQVALSFRTCCRLSSQPLSTQEVLLSCARGGGTRLGAEAHGRGADRVRRSRHGKPEQPRHDSGAAQGSTSPEL